MQKNIGLKECIAHAEGRAAGNPPNRSLIMLNRFLAKISNPPNISIGLTTVCLSMVIASSAVRPSFSSSAAFLVMDAVFGGSLVGLVLNTNKLEKFSRERRESAEQGERDLAIFEKEKVERTKSGTSSRKDPALTPVAAR